MIDDEIQRRLDELDRKISRHSDLLNEAIAQRDRLALDAAWGILEGGAGPLIWLAVLGAYSRFGWDAWWGWACAFVVAWALSWWATMKAIRARLKEVDRLAVLPGWDETPTF